MEFVLIHLLSRSNMSSVPPHQAPSTVSTPMQPASGTPNPQIPEHDASRPRTPQEAERFFRRIALENQPPSRTMRWLSIGGWVAGACKSPFFPFCRTPDTAISSARRDVRTLCGLSRTPCRSSVVSTLLYIMPYVTCSSLRVSCFLCIPSRSVAAGYMVLYADFGDREHVFSPVRCSVRARAGVSSTDLGIFRFGVDSGHSRGR